ncbi:M24 family metallopeptidase [Denitrobaculum tricleocarpae]|uniref:Aminopeptidase P family protein n=1 Tax=Denitrobaculum tricleocarpae TaxID=2591009 RepID=A0A545TGN5_9PROT|nr:M24 family metallopeptidase [Denitrobaculum tricleocarpae]TQV76291.1 aminopeptidase P family protein [Denitrobaculum tricleocarpae]
MISPSAGLTPETAEARRAQILARATDAGNDAVLVFGYGSALGAGSKSHGTMRYLTGWDSHEATSLLVINKGDRVLFISSPFMVPIARERLQDVEIIDLRPSEWAAGLKARLTATRNVGTIGFDEMPVSLYRMLTPALEHLRLQSIDRLLGEMQLIKDEEALQLHVTGAKICDELFAALQKEISKGTPCWQTQLALETKARGLGADYCRTWLTARPSADHPRYWPEEGLHVPQPGDQVLFGIALTVAGHWAHGIRMGSMGPAPEPHKAMWRLASEMLAAGVAALTPGQALSGCMAAINQVLCRHTSAEERTSLSGFRYGHGLGLSYEDPFITDCFPQSFGAAAPSGISGPAEDQVQPDLTLQPGMLMELHPNFFSPERGGAAIGEMIVIRESGAEALLKFPTSFMEL